MTKRRTPPPVPFFTVSKPTSDQRATKERPKRNRPNYPEAESERTPSEARENDIRSASEARENSFTVPHKLPSLNDYINACRANRYKGAKLKENTEALIACAILQAQSSGTLRPPKLPIRLAFVWHEKTRRRDADNIASAKKFILDAMQHVGIIPNDSRKYVTGFTDEIVDDDRDFVEVRIIESDFELKGKKLKESRQ